MGLTSSKNEFEKMDDAQRPRVAVMSMRNQEFHVSRACGYEFEDMICEELDSARLVAPGPGGRTLFQRKLRNGAARMVGDRKFIKILNLGADKIRLDADYELFFFSAAQLRDLAELTAIPDWRNRSRFAVCWMQELWARDIIEENHILDILNQFDHVICSFFHSVEPLRGRISAPVTYMPWGVDAELFCPFPNPPARVIKVAGIGLVPKHTERALVHFADETGKFFHYQTVFGPSVAHNHREHRQNYAGLLKRSEYFLSFLAKFSNAERGTQKEFGLRYIEGVAAGTVMLGDLVDNPAFSEWFDWPDSVIPLSVEDPEPQALIRELDDTPERIAAARRGNLVNALRRLDNLYRWEDVLRLAGMQITPAMLQRRKRLEALANEISAASDATLLMPNALDGSGVLLKSAGFANDAI